MRITAIVGTRPQLIKLAALRPHLLPTSSWYAASSACCEPGSLAASSSSGSGPSTCGSMAGVSQRSS